MRGRISGCLCEKNYPYDWLLLESNDQFLEDPCLSWGNQIEEAGQEKKSYEHTGWKLTGFREESKSCWPIGVVDLSEVGILVEYREHHDFSSIEVKEEIIFRELNDWSQKMGE